MWSNGNVKGPIQTYLQQGEVEQHEIKGFAQKHHQEHITQFRKRTHYLIIMSRTPSLLTNLPSHRISLASQFKDNGRSLLVWCHKRGMTPRSRGQQVTSWTNHFLFAPIVKPITVQLIISIPCQNPVVLLRNSWQLCSLDLERPITSQILSSNKGSGNLIFYIRLPPCSIKPGSSPCKIDWSL